MEALVSHEGFNMLASFQKSLMFGHKTATCSDQNNPNLYQKPMAGRTLCLPMTIGSTTGDMVLYTAACMGRQPACLLFSRPIDSLGEEVLQAVCTGNSTSVEEDDTVTMG